MEELIKQKLFETIYEIDSLGATVVAINKEDETGKRLRKMHYANCDWLTEVGLQEEYYNYFVERIGGKIKC